MWTSIKLARTQPPTFPNRCAACGVERPGESFLVGPPPWNLVVNLILMCFSPSKQLFILKNLTTARAPACSLCRLAIRKKVILLFLASFLVTILTLCLMLALVVQVQAKLILPPLPKWLVIPSVLVLGVGTVLPALLLVHRFPPRPVEVWISGSELVFKFRDGPYAREFEAINSRSADVQRQS